MATVSGNTRTARGAKRSTERPLKGSAGQMKIARDTKTGQLLVSKAGIEAVMQAGIETDTDLIEFALATVTLEDNFSEAFKQFRGKVGPDLKLGC